jgi:hypothetical protein
MLKLLCSSAFVAAAAPLVRVRRAHASSVTSPRFYLQIIPQGGMDAIYTTDPKTVAQVDPGIDVPFAPGAIVETSGMQLGPSFKKLAPWAARLAVVNAFHQNSANHVSGLLHTTRFKSSSTLEMPTLLDILGARRHDEATGCFSIGAVMTTADSPGYLGEPSELTFGKRPGLFEHLDASDPDDLRVLATALRREAEPLRGARASASEQGTASNLLATAELFERTASSPKFAPAAWPHALESVYHNGDDLQRALWLFENKLTRCVVVCVGEQDFDTHLSNTTYQPVISEYLGSLLDRLFSELDRRVVDHRPLSEQTAVIVGSEIGRFPRLNSSHGKDHFPQAPYLFFGKWFDTGASYGGSGRDMATVPISLASGRPDRGGHVLRVDDIGTTLLALDGADPELSGYTGEHLRFLAP